MRRTVVVATAALLVAASGTGRGHRPAVVPAAPPDADGDGLSDAFEREWGSDPSRMDSDGDGLVDPGELDAGADPRDPDSDDDGWWDGEEVLKRRTSPRRAEPPAPVAPRGEED